ncbi:MAG: glycosyltransferase family 4 protein [Kiritimatiellia bacterium]
MHIAIDARWIFREITGIGNYTRELICELVRLDRNNCYTLLFNDAELEARTAEESGFRQASNFRSELVSWGLFSLANQLLLSGKLARARVDVFHSTNYMIPLLPFPRHRAGKIKCVVTIHDLIPLTMRQQVARSRKARLFHIYRLLMREVALRADALIVVSRTAAEEVRKQFGFYGKQAAKVFAIYNGVSSRFHTLPGHSAAVRSFDPSAPATVLYVGRADPYKNLITLIRAFHLLSQTCPRRVQLRIVGPRDPRYPEPEQLVATLGIGKSVVWTGYVSDEELVRLYRQADVLVHPSRYEGFGLPILEAMACGTPVICSTAGALPEVAGEAAVLLAPDDVEGFARAMARVLTDPVFASSLSEKGLHRATCFSWQRTVRETLVVYEKVFNLPTGSCLEAEAL